MVKSKAKKITQAVISHAYNGELAPAKYLLEMAGVYPASVEESTSSADEESLAKTLLDRLNIPDNPVVHDEYEKGDEIVVIRPRLDEDSQTETEESGEKAKAALVGAE